MHESARQFLVELGRRITSRDRDRDRDREDIFCFSAFQFCRTVSIQFYCTTV